MKLRLMLAAATLVLLSACVPQYATPVIFKANLSGAQQVPANSSTAVGAAVLVLDEANKKITLVGSFSGVAATIAHIHGPAAKGVNAGVLIPLSVDAAKGTLSKESVVTDAQIADLKAGKWYVNIHSQAFPGGEIRGQLE